MVEHAEAHLGARDIERALAAYAEIASEGCEDADRVDGGRWMCHMLTGDYAAAWRCSDAIRSRGAEDAHRFWHGEPIDGRRLMLRCLHGYGDTVMYLRWLPELRRRCSELVVQACPEMLLLIRAMAEPTSETPDVRHTASVHVASWGAAGKSDRDQWDVQVESAELPYLFRTTTATLPEPVPLRFPEVELHRIRMRLGERTKPRVGLVWTGSNYDPARSVPFASFQRLFECDSHAFWSLQAPENNGEWAEYCAERGWRERTFYTRAGTDELHHSGIADMAAFASEMDLVITIDTMAAHIAGSLGLPTWLLLKREADWRWMLDRDSSPWYPTMKVFRQSTAGEWDEPLTRVCDALRDDCEEQEA